MFLFCITRNSVARGAGLPAVREFPVGQWLVTAATDDWLASSSRQGGRVVVGEAAPFGTPGGNAEATTLVEISFDEASGAVELFKSLLGGRQVYYHAAPDGSFYCASHLRLLKSAGVRLEEDPQRLPELFVFRYVSPPRTLLKGIDQLVAGERLRFSREGGAWRKERTGAYSPP